MSNTVYDIVTDRLVKILEQGVSPWNKPWASQGLTMAVNYNSKKAYRGINAILTNMAGFGSPYWLTYKQASAMGGQVRKGEKGTPIVFWAKQESDDPSRKDRFIIRYYTAFNLEQIDGINAPKVERVNNEFESIASCDRIVAGFKTMPKLSHGGNQAFYRPASDEIWMPNKSDFKSSAGYYGTLFHEMAHATGHESRLNREAFKQIVRFGSHEYSKEELVAEMTSAFLCAESGIDSPDMIGNSASYLQSWIRALKGDKTLALQAAGQAQKAADFILGRNFNLDNNAEA